MFMIYNNLASLLLYQTGGFFNLACWYSQLDMVLFRLVNLIWLQISMSLCLAFATWQLSGGL
jgi:hypothetical protein